MQQSLIFDLSVLRGQFLSAFDMVLHCLLFCFCSVSDFVSVCPVWIHSMLVACLGSLSRK